MSNNKLKYYRLSKNLTQYELADKLKIHVASYQRLEYGTRKPKLVTALAIAKILNTTVEDLFDTSSRQTRKVNKSSDKNV